MRITIKIKHLMLSLIVMVMTVYVLISVILPRIELSAARQQFEIGSKEGKMGILNAIHHSVSDESKWELIREYMIEFGEEENDAMMGFNVYIGPGTTYMSESGSREQFTWTEKLEFVSEFTMNAPVDGYVMRAAKQLAYYYSRNGQLDTAIEVLEQTARRFKGDRYQWQHNELKLEQGRLLVVNKEDAEAKRILDHLAQGLDVQDFHMHAEITLLKEKMMISREDQHLSQVSGTLLRADGTPIPNAGVFLRHESIINRSVTSSEPHQILTDEQGSFKFDDVIPGSYQLYLGLDFDQISGWTWPVMNDEWLDIRENEKVQQDIILYPLMELKSPVNEAVLKTSSLEFVWSQVDGASYYNVNIGMQLKKGSVGGTLAAHIPNDRYSIKTSLLYDKITGISFNQVDGRSVADPLSLLGFSNTNNRFYWNVEAYDENDKMITRSNGYRLSDDGIGNLPFFYLQERTMSPADILLLDGHHDQALTAYKDDFKQNSTDIHSLRMIIRLLDPEEEKLPYLQSMVNMNPTEEYVFALAHYYYEQQNWAAFVETYNTNHIDISYSSYTQSIYATALMKLGRLQEARRLFQQAMDSDLSHRFVGNYIAIALYEDEDLKSALDIAQRYPERNFGGNGTNWYELITQLEKESEKSTQPNNYMEELRQKLSWIIKGDNEQLELWMSTSEQSGAIAFIQAILDVE